MDTHFVNNLYQKLKHDLQEYSLSSYLSENDLSTCINICDIYINQLRTYISTTGFTTIEEEIHFFKELKPRFLHRHYFYDYIMHTEINMPLHDPDEIIPYLQERKRAVHAFQSENRNFCNYIRLNKSNLDAVYFTRETQYKWECDMHYLSRDPLFHCPKDDILTQVKASKAILKFLDRKIKFMQGALLPFDESLKWNATKVSLIELCYGIWCTNACDADILTISKALGTLFNVNTEDAYRAFTDIKARKIEPTKFIRKMDKSLLNYIKNHD